MLLVWVLWVLWFLCLGMFINIIPKAFKVNKYVRGGWWWRFIPSSTDAMVVYPFTLFRDSNSERIPLWLFQHELTHMQQIRRDGLLVFYFKYLYFNFRYGYEKNPYEVEAYEVSGRGE